jgi:hypothetical protein
MARQHPARKTPSRENHTRRRTAGKKTNDQDPPRQEAVEALRGALMLMNWQAQLLQETLERLEGDGDVPLPPAGRRGPRSSER